MAADAIPAQIEKGASVYWIVQPVDLRPSHTRIIKCLKAITGTEITSRKKATRLLVAISSQNLSIKTVCL